MVNQGTDVDPGSCCRPREPKHHTSIIQEGICCSARQLQAEFNGDVPQEAEWRPLLGNGGNGALVYEVSEAG